MTSTQLVDAPASAEEINARFARQYGTQCSIAREGEDTPDARSKSYYYDSQALERLEPAVKEFALADDLPRCTLIEVCRLTNPLDQRSVIEDAAAAQLGCRQVRKLVGFIRQLSRIRLRNMPVPEELAATLTAFLQRHPAVGNPLLRSALPKND